MDGGDDMVDGHVVAGRAHLHTLLRHRSPGETIVASQRQGGPRGV
jgi:hypothetical protein